MLKENKPYRDVGGSWSRFYLEKHRVLYEDLMSKDFDTLEKEILKTIKELEKFGEKIEKEFKTYSSKNWRICLTWILDCFNRYIDLFAKHYVLDVLILDNPKDGPVTRVYKELKNEVVKRVKRIVAYNSEETANELVIYLLMDDMYGSAIEFLSEENIPMKIIKYTNILKRAEILNEYSAELGRKYYYPHLTMLIDGIQFYYRHFFHKENLDSPQELTIAIKRLEKILKK